MEYQIPLPLSSQRPRTERGTFAPAAWKPVIPPALPPGRIGMDSETTGLQVYDGDKAVGFSVATLDGRAWYLPTGHKEGPNLPEHAVKSWLKDNVTNRDIAMAEAKFDVQTSRTFGVDLEALHARPRDVQFAAALLDDSRRKFSLNSMSIERLGRTKLSLSGKNEIALMSPAYMHEYAEEDARLALELDTSYESEIRAQELDKVLELENSLIFCTLEMERNGTYVDIPKLEKWRGEVQTLYLSKIMEIHRRTGLQVNPQSGNDMARLFQYLGHPQLNFDEAVLHAYSHIPEVKLADEARNLKSLKSKYIDAYLAAAAPNGMLRYKLNQLRGDEYGTITGRYSSARQNIQQVYKPSKQDEATINWIIREVFLPHPGTLWCSGDASQIEYRLFAHFSNSQRLIDAYKNPKTDFHQIISELTGLQRDFAKNFNFMKLYGGGVEKAAMMLGIPVAEAEPIDAQYDELFPEAKKLMRRAIRIAERRGYVRSILGRRRRFPDRDFAYAALNAAIQMSAADLLKLCLLAVYRERKNLGLEMWFTVHDEIDVGVHSPADGERLRQFMDEQRFPLRVPITWEVKCGENWRLGYERKPVQS